MQSILELKSNLFRTVKVTAITDIIGGGVYRGKAPSNNQTENVEILSGANVNDIVQDCTLFVNYHTEDLPDTGEQDEKKFKNFAAVLLPLLDDDDQYQIIDDTVFINDQRPGWSYYSVRVRVYSFNDKFVE